MLPFGEHANQRSWFIFYQGSNNKNYMFNHFDKTTIAFSYNVIDHIGMKSGYLI